MSTTLYWQPARRPKGRPLPTALKFALSPVVFDHDGSLSSPPMVLNVTNRDYLVGLRDGRVEGAAELIGAIDTFGQIEIWTE